MAFPMTHLQVAYELLEVLPGIKDPCTFIVGSIAPDSVHFREGYNGKIKATSHIWRWGPKWGVTLELDKWMEDIKKFWNDNRVSFEDYDFIAGYTVHVLTDWMNDYYVWQPFDRQYRTVTWDGITYHGINEAQYDEIFAAFRKELAVMNVWLYGNSPDSDRILDMLKKGKRYEYPGLIEADDLDRAIDSLLYTQFSRMDDYGESACKDYTPEVVTGFIDKCVKEIPPILL